MYKILLVDDEILIRVGLKSIINWQEHEFAIVGEASDGLEAVELINQYNPHIVITDIKMPDMDGIELIKWAKDHSPHIKFIVLSCHNEFEYVKEAMKLGAVDYILKLSMEPEKLLEVLLETKSIVKSESIITQNITHSENRSFASNKKYQFLKNLIEENSTQDNSHLYLDGISLNFNSNSYIVMLLEFDKYWVLLQNQVKDKDFFDISVANIVEEVIAAKINYDYFILENGLHALFIEITNNNYIWLLEDSFNRINETLLNYLNITVSASISEIANNLSLLKKYLNQCKKAIELKFYKGYKSFTIYSDYIKMVHNDILTPDIEGKLSHLAETCNTEMFELELLNLFELIDKRKYYPSNVRKCFMNIIFILDKTGRSINLSISETGYVFEEIYDLIGKIDTFDALKDWISKFSLKYINELRNAKTKKFSKLVVTTLDYIKNNYKNQISIKSAAKIVCVNPDYLSHLFKLEVDSSFTSYLTKLRIDEAKKLLKTSDLKIYEISQMLGYDNASYFSKLFKKIVGISVSDYKKS